MAPVQNSCDFLAGEVLGEMAGTFFGRRKALENLIDLVLEYADAFRPRVSAVTGRAGFLNHLLLESPAVEAFYAAIGVPSHQTLMVEGFDRHALPARIPSALFPADRFKKLFRWAYEALRKACDRYLYGPPQAGPAPDQTAEIQPSYDLIMKLVERANEEVDRINREVSPSAVLQSARKFGPIGPYRRQLEETSPGVECVRLDQVFAFSPIDLQALALKAVPELPEAASVARKADDFCSDFYKAHRRPIGKMMAGLTRQIREGGA